MQISKRTSRGPFLKTREIYVDPQKSMIKTAFPKFSFDKKHIKSKRTWIPEILSFNNICLGAHGENSEFPKRSPWDSVVFLYTFCNLKNKTTAPLERRGCVSECMVFVIYSKTRKSKHLKHVLTSDNGIAQTEKNASFAFWTPWFLLHLRDEPRGNRDSRTRGLKKKKSRFFEDITKS